MTVGSQMAQEASGLRLAVLLGNTTCRMALMDGIEVRRRLVFSHAELSAPEAGERVRELCGGAVVEEAGLCSVVPGLESSVEVLLQAAGLAPPRRVVPGVSAFFPSRYRSMGTLGADRYCGVLAAKEKYGVPLIVVDCGTATTINVVDRDGVFLGGAIAPGVMTMLRAMHEHTAQLPPLFPGSTMEELSDNTLLQKESSSMIGEDTASSMRSGSAFFTRFAVEGMAAEVKNLIGDKTPLVLTGGNALILLGAGLHCKPQVFDEDLLLRGIIFFLLFTR